MAKSKSNWELQYQGRGHREGQYVVGDLGLLSNRCIIDDNFARISVFCLKKNKIESINTIKLKLERIEFGIREKTGSGSASTCDDQWQNFF